MTWHYYQKHIDEKSIVYDFINTIISVYGATKTFSVYEKIEGRSLFIYLKTDDNEISRKFIDYFIDGIPTNVSDSEIDNLNLIYSK